MIAAVKALPATPTAVAHPCGASSLTSTIDAAKLGIIAPDRPSSMADLAGIAASHKANTLDIHHGSPFTSAQYRETEIDLTVELAGPEQAQALLQAFEARGYKARSFSLE